MALGPAHVDDANTLAHWKLDETGFTSGGAINDSTGNLAAGTSTGTTYSEGLVQGYSRSFVAANVQYGTAPSNATLRALFKAGGPLRFNAIIKRVSAATGPIISLGVDVADAGSNTTNQLFTVDVRGNTNTTLRVFWQTGANVFQILTGSIPIPLATETYVTVLMTPSGSNASVTILVNGVVDVTGTLPLPDNPAATPVFYFGTYRPTAAAFWFDGLLDDIFIENVSRTAAVIYAEYAASMLPPASPNPASPGVTTLGTIRTACKERTDNVGVAFLSDAEWLRLINSSYQELYGLVVQKFGNDYFTQTTAGGVTLTTDGTTFLYPLQTNFFKLLGVDLYLANSHWSILKPFTFAERNMFGPQSVPRAGQTLRYFYVPRWTPLVNDTDTVDGVNGWEEYIVADCAIKALAKEEADVSVHMATKAALLQRIEAEAENRDAGQPFNIVDIRSKQALGMRYRVNGNNLWLIGQGTGADSWAPWDDNYERGWW